MIMTSINHTPPSAAAKSFPSKPPYSRVYVEITNNCNMHCSFCHGHSRSPRKITQEQFSRILDQLTGKTQYLYYHLMGEPLLHPELPQFLRMARLRGFHSVITTNGTLLKKRGQELLDAGLHKISISLHSFEEKDDTHFENYLREVAEFANAAWERGVVVVLRLWNRGFDEGRNQKALSFLQQQLPGQWVENAKGLRIRDKFFLEWGDRFQWPDLTAPIQGQQVFCYGLRDQFGILSDGTVVPCCLDSNGVINLGNLFEENIDDILTSPRATAMIDGFSCRKASEELCRRCGYAQRFV